MYVYVYISVAMNIDMNPSWPPIFIMFLISRPPHGGSSKVTDLEDGREDVPQADTSRDSSVSRLSSRLGESKSLEDIDNCSHGYGSR